MVVTTHFSNPYLLTRTSINFPLPLSTTFAEYHPKTCDLPGSVVEYHPLKFLPFKIPDLSSLVLLFSDVAISLSLSDIDCSIHSEIESSNRHLGELSIN